MRAGKQDLVMDLAGGKPRHLCLQWHTAAAEGIYSTVQYSTVSSGSALEYRFLLWEVMRRFPDSKPEPLHLTPYNEGEQLLNFGTWSSSP